MCFTMQLLWFPQFGFQAANDAINVKVILPLFSHSALLQIKTFVTLGYSFLESSTFYICVTKLVSSIVGFSKLLFEVSTFERKIGKEEK